MNRLCKFAVTAIVLCLAGTGAARAQSVEQIAAAVLPLPEDLKAGATIYNYDAGGERKVLRAGSNGVECMPMGKDGFIWCYSVATRERRDFSAKLRGQGKSEKEIGEATAEATNSGAIKAAPMGAMMYRYSDDPKRIKLLWVMQVPNQTPESLGVSTASQRDAGLKGHGMPWMMLPGTPGAHIMIPINNTPLSSTDNPAR